MDMRFQSSRFCASGSPRAFSLVEMMAVIAIMTIVMSLTMPALQSTVKSTGRKGAVSLLLGAFDQARSIALSNGRPVYMVFAGESAPEAYRNRAFAFYLESESSVISADNDSTESDDNPDIAEESRTSELNDFVPASRWELLPEGISLKSEAFSLLQSGKSPVREFPVPEYLSPARAMALHYLKFDEAGMVEYPADSSLLRLLFFEGTINGSGTEKHQSSLASKADTSPEEIRSADDDRSMASLYFDEIKVSRYTGKARWTTIIP